MTILGVPDIKRLEEGLERIHLGKGGCFKRDVTKNYHLWLKKHGIETPVDPNSIPKELYQQIKNACDRLFRVDCEDWLCSQIAPNRKLWQDPCEVLSRDEIIDRVERMIATGRTLED